MHTLSRRTIGGLIILAALGMFYWLIPAPRLLLQGAQSSEEKMAFNGPMILHFNQGMNRKSVEEHLTASPELEGDFIWRTRKILEYWPKSPLKINEEYRVRLGKQAKTIYGKSFPEDQVLRFRVTGPPFVRFVDPPDQAPEEDPVITVMFDRSMETSQKLADWLLIDPPAEGRLEWLTPTAFQFFSKTWQKATLYTLTVPAGVKAMGGGATEAEFRWQIRTTGLTVRKTQPEHEAVKVDLDAQLRVQLSDPVELDQIQPGKNALLFPSNDLDAPLEPREDGFFNTEVTHGTDPQGKTDKTVLVFTPTFPYQPQESYRLILKSGLQGPSEKLTMAEDFELRFYTKPAELKSISAEPQKVLFYSTQDAPDLPLEEWCSLEETDFLTQSQNFSWQNFECASPQKKAIESPLNQGFYFAALKGAGTQPFIISDARLFLKTAPHTLLVWAVDTGTLLPIPAMAITVLGKDGETLAQGKTDDEGIYTLPRSLEKGFFVRGQKEKTVTINRDLWQADAKEKQADPAPNRLYFYTNRREYRPGERLHFRGIYRGEKEGQLTLPAPLKLELSIRNPLSEEAPTDLLPLFGRNGSFFGSWNIPSDFLPGRYLMAAAIQKEGEETHFEFPLWIKPLALRTAQLVLKQDQEHYTPGEPIQIQEELTLASGAAAPGAAGQFTLIREPFLPPIDSNDKLYTFTPIDSQGAWEVIHEGSLTLDEWGRAAFNLDPNSVDLSPGYHYRFGLELNSPEGDRVNGTLDFWVHPGDYYLGIAPQDYSKEKGEPLSFSLVAADREGRLLPGKKVHLFLEEAGARKTLLTAGEPLSVLWEAELKEGLHHLRAESEDEKGRTIVTQIPLYVPGGKSPLSDRPFEFLSDQPENLVGGKAHAWLTPLRSAQKQKILVTREQADSLEHEVIEAKPEGNTLEILIEETMVPILPMTATVLAENGSDFYTAQNSLLVSRRDKEIRIEMDAEWQEKEGQKNALVRLKTVDYQNRPLSAQVVIAASSAPIEVPQLLEYFYPRTTESNTPLSPPALSVALPENPFYEEKLVKTDEGGWAEVTLPLSAGLSEAHLLVLATQDLDRFGMATQTLASEKPLNLTPDLPERISPGDNFKVGVTLQNTLDRPLEIPIELIAPGLLIKDVAKRPLLIKKGESVKVEWAVTALPSFKTRIPIAFRTPHTFLTRDLPLGPRGVQTIFHISGITLDTISKTISIPAELAEKSGYFRLKVGSNLNALEPHALLTAQGDPSPFLPEQISHLWSSILSNDEEVVKEALHELQWFYREGGYSRWTGSRSLDPFWTAYALFVLRQMPSQEPSLLHLEETTRYLWEAMESQDLTPEEKVFIIWSLSQAESYDTRLTLNLFQDRASLPINSQALLLATLQNLMEAGQKSLSPFAERLKSELASRLLGEEGQSVIALWALARVSPQNPLLPDLLKRITEEDKIVQNHPLDRQKRLWKMWALREVQKHQSLPVSEFEFRAELAGETILKGTTNPKNPNQVWTYEMDLKNLDPNDVLNLKIEKEGFGPLYFDAELIYFTDPKSSPASADFVLKREEQTDGDTLTMIVPESLSNVLLQESVPAGARLLALDSVWPFDDYQIDRGTLWLFAKKLPAGVYTLHFSTEVIRSGQFYHPPTQVHVLTDD